MGRACWLIAALIAASACQGERKPPPVTESPTATFVGSRRCADCHRDQSAAWSASQHALAMQEPTPANVLAPFRGETAAYAGVTSTFSQRNGRYVARTDGPDGRLADFEIKYTFGVAPLQQYLIELPGGRIQSLGLAWDSRPSPDGQRWFHLYPGERIRAGDPLHWTGLQQNWNFMCADCHSTNVRKNYDATTRTFRTAFSEISVGCEACHGPASVHVAMAENGQVRPGTETGLRLSLDERRGAGWGRDARTGQPVRSTPRTTEREIDVCARCHSRRAQLTDAVTAADRFHDAFRVSLLEPALYYPDGQQRDEVYTYGSFLQSKMHAAGVTCSDCHDPHSGKVRLPGNATCATCHDAPTYDSVGHHFHQQGTPGASCLACHMPSTTYMVVDPRHDHSFRVPRPDRSVSLGVPNACQACHAKNGDAWAAEIIRKRRPSGSPGFQSFAEAFAAFDRGAAGGADGLVRVAGDASQSAIARASALERLAHAGVQAPADVLVRAARDASPLVRRAAAAFPLAASGFSQTRAADGSTPAALLDDPVVTVRLEAASTLGRIPPDQVPPALAAGRSRALQEYASVQRFSADRPDAQLNLSSALAAAGDIGGAVAAAREAITLDPTFVPAYVNLGDLYRMQGDETAVERVLRDGIPHAGGSGAVHHALGLSLVRQKRMKDALAALAEAAKREPDNSRYALVYAVALNDTGRPADAIRVLRDFLSRRPGDPDVRATLEAYERR
jgi:tetratricopeptide (TPR) repeat protein